MSADLRLVKVVAAHSVQRTLNPAPDFKSRQTNREIACPLPFWQSAIFNTHVYCRAYGHVQYAMSFPAALCLDKNTFLSIIERTGRSSNKPLSFLRRRPPCRTTISFITGL